MVVYENCGPNPLGVNITKAYSDQGMYIERDGIEYEDAYDPTDLHLVYTETNHPIEDDDYAEAGRILLGVAS